MKKIFVFAAIIAAISAALAYKFKKDETSTNQDENLSNRMVDEARA